MVTLKIQNSGLDRLGMAHFLTLRRHGRPQGVWAKRAFPPLEIGTKEAKISRKREISILILISWVNSCNNSLFADMTLTQQKSQVHCSGRLTCSDELAVH